MNKLVETGGIIALCLRLSILKVCMISHAVNMRSCKHQVQVSHRKEHFSEHRDHCTVMNATTSDVRVLNPSIHRVAVIMYSLMPGAHMVVTFLIMMEMTTACVSTPTTMTVGSTVLVLCRDTKAMNVKLYP